MRTEHVHLTYNAHYLFGTTNNLPWIGVATGPKIEKHPRILSCFIIHAPSSVRIASDVGIPILRSTCTFIYRSVSVFPQLSPFPPRFISSPYPKSSPSPSPSLSPSQSQLKQIFIGEAHQTVTRALPVCKNNCLLILFDWGKRKSAFLKKSAWPKVKV